MTRRSPLRRKEEAIMNKRIRRISVLLTAVVLCAAPGPGTILGYGAGTRETVEPEVMVGIDHISDIPAASQTRGWVTSGSDWMYYQEDGSILRESLTPDGYFVDIEGKWRQRTMTLLDEKFSLPDTFRASTGTGSFLTDMEPLERLNTRIRKLIGEKRLFYVYEDSIQYRNGNSGQGTFVMGIYKSPSDGGWRLRLSGLLNKATNRTMEETCDYAVFRFFLAQVSHVPERVSEAIYDSWQGNNAYGINMQTPVMVGDVAVTYTVENGIGVYILTDARQYRQ